MKKCALFVCLFHVCSGVIYKLNDREYDLMPPIFHMDPYETCLHQPEGLYCSVAMTLVSDTPSPLLNMIRMPEMASGGVAMLDFLWASVTGQYIYSFIFRRRKEEYSDHTVTHFNHTKLYYGVCVTHSCKTIYGNTATDLRTTLEACLNQSMWNDYQLKVKITDNLYCNTNNRTMELDSSDIAVGAICILLLVANIVGSVYDIFCTKVGNKYLLCFSIRRNWRRLVAPTLVADCVDPRMKQLKGIQGIRAILTSLVILAHSMLPTMMVIDNPGFVEQLYYYLPIQLLLNGTLAMQIFLIISGFLLVYNMQVFAEKHTVSWIMVPQTILKRWLRLTPSYAIVLAFTATWVRHFGSGPLWEKIVMVESTDCRRSWWYFLLYVNNYIDNSKCMPQAWYLAADTQLYCLGLLVCVLCKSSRTRKVVLSSLFVIGLIIPIAHTYIQDLDAVVIVSPEAGTNLFAEDRTFNNVYKRGHTNIACYILGLALGYLVHHWQIQNNLQIDKYRKYRIFYWALLPLGVTIILVGSVFYQDAPRGDVIYRALYAGLVKPLFGFVIALLLLGMIFNIEDVYRGVLEWSGWQCMGRVSYIAYLFHVAIIRGFSGQQTTVFHVTILGLAQTVIYALSVTFIGASIFWMTVETPIGQLIKTYLEHRKPVDTKNDIGENSTGDKPEKTHNKAITN